MITPRREYPQIIVGGLFHGIWNLKAKATIMGIESKNIQIYEKHFFDERIMEKNWIRNIIYFFFFSKFFDQKIK